LLFSAFLYLGLAFSGSLLLFASAIYFLMRIGGDFWEVEKR